MAERREAPRPFGGMRRGPFMEVERAADIKGTLRRLAGWLGHERWLAAGLLAVVTAGTLAGIVAPAIQSRVVDVIAGSRGGRPGPALAAMMAAYLAFALCQFAQGLLGAHLTRRLVRRLREALFGKLVSLPIGELDRHPHGDFISRMTNDIETLSGSAAMALPALFSGTLTLVGTAAVMCWFCWQLALLSCASILLTVFATRALARLVRRHSRRRQQLLGELNGTVEEMVNGYRTVIAYNYQREATEGFCATADELTRAGIRTDVFGGVMGPLMNCIGNLGFILVAAGGGYFALKGLVSVGVISAFVVYARQFSRPVNELAQIYGQLQNAVAGAERVFAVLDLPSEAAGGRAAEADRPAAVAFRGIDFAYEPGKPVLQDFTLEIKAGQKVALVGATGSGKTTLASLLLRFYEPQRGVITLGGEDIAALSLESLRRQIAIVPQETTLFTGTVRENLLYANPAATPGQLDEAVRLARCDELIARLPQGYDTPLEHAGAGLSAGERQLLAIARVCAASPRVLILDEATSNVDTRTERAIQEALRQAMRNRTGIIIAHRLSTIRDADRIVVLDHGRIAECGTHRELLARRGRYHDLYMTQFAGFAT